MKNIKLYKTRVRVKNDYYEKELHGKTGIIVNINDGVCTVYFEDWHEGHNGRVYAKFIPDCYKGTNSCWNIYAEALVVIEDEYTLKIDNDVYSITDDGCVYTKSMYEKWEEKYKKKEENDNMKLLDIFERNLRNNIDKYFEELEDNIKKDNPIVKEYNRINEEYLKSMEGLFKSQNIDECIMGDGYIFKPPYELDNDALDKIEGVRLAEELKEAYLQDVSDKLEKVRAQIDLIKSCKTDNEYDLIMDLLKEQGIINKNTIVDVDVAKAVEKDVKTMINAAEQPKRGRKVKKSE